MWKGFDGEKDVFMGWEVEFHRTNDEDETPDCQREFIIGSPTRNDMEVILKLFIDKRIKFDERVHLNYNNEEMNSEVRQDAHDD